MKTTLVRDVMTSEVTTLKRNEKLSLAQDVMQLGRIRHLPVLDDEEKEVVGMVTQRDLFRGALARALGYGEHASRKVLDTLLVKDVMETDVVTTTPETPLADAARVLMERKIGSLPVVKDGRLVGILTEGDFVALVARQG
ncbi:MAG TPA: CBS domain-containing protein [Candidatus Binataceae bacterium]|jgi:CBS domain-containing protein|nr:CBS domain-containing protein [Candidatus Binataceae bacterium]